MFSKYPIAVEKPDGDTAYGVVFPDIAGCYSAGETLDEAISNAKEALEGFLDMCREEGDPIPKPGSIDSHKNDTEFDKFIWSFIEIDLTPYLGKSKKINVTLPEYLIRQIDVLASTDPQYKTRSGFLAAAAAHELQARR